jgi:hypothetical protein
MTTLLGIAVALTPFLMIVGLLRLAERVAQRREAGRARQIALTDAIHRELGAAAAPLVRRRVGGGWLVTMMVPLDRPGTVAALLRITHRVLGPGEGTGGGRLLISLTPQGSSPAVR